MVFVVICSFRLNDGKLGVSGNSTRFFGFSYTEGPQAMVSKAIMYGGIMYLLSGNLMEKKEPFQYMEETVDF